MDALNGSVVMESSTVSPERLGDMCGQSNRADPLVQAFMFWASGVAVSVVGMAGLIGNLLSLITIATMTKRSLFNRLLFTLTAFDLLFISNGGIFMVKHAFEFKSELYNLLFPKVIYPLASISMTGSTYSCMAIAIERYIGICGPRASTSNGRKTAFYLVSIFACCVLLEIPKFFEIESKYDKNGKFESFGYSSLRENKAYIEGYVLWFRLFATAAIPFLMMLFFNFRILLYFKRNRHVLSAKAVREAPAASADHVYDGIEEQESRGSGGSRGHHHHRLSRRDKHLLTFVNQERSLYITFFCITTTFLLCHLPRIILNVYELPMSHYREICLAHNRTYYSPQWVVIGTCIQKICLIFNSSINFVFYCLAGKSFRKQMFKVIFRRLVRICRKLSSRQPDGAADYKSFAGGNEPNTTTALTTTGTNITTARGATVSVKPVTVVNLRSEERQCSFHDGTYDEMRVLRHHPTKSSSDWSLSLNSTGGDHYPMPLSTVIVHKATSPGETCYCTRSTTQCMLAPLEVRHSSSTPNMCQSEAFCWHDLPTKPRSSLSASCLALSNSPICRQASVKADTLRAAMTKRPTSASTEDFNDTNDGDDDASDVLSQNLSEGPYSYSCSSVTSRSSRDSQCPKCLILSKNSNAAVGDFL